MAKKYTYSRSVFGLLGQETFSAVEFDSFDEARKVVDKAVYERKLELDKELPKDGSLSGLLRGPAAKVNVPQQNNPSNVPVNEKSGNPENGASDSE